MPFKITTLSFNRDSLLSTGGFVLIKNILLFLTFLSLLAGLILIGGGSVLTSSNSNQFGIGTSIGAAAIVIGIIVTIVSFFGCFGAANDKGILLKTYFVLLAILILLEISVGIAAAVKANEIDQVLEAGWKFYYNQNDTASILDIETTFRCCGFRNVTDMAYPSDCASVLQYEPSCLSSISDSVEKSLGTISGAGIALGVLEILGLLFSAFLFNKIAKRQDANSSLANETWRINQNKVQYGYQNYQYA